MFLGLLDPDPDPLVRGMDPDPSILEHNNYLCTYDLYRPVHNVLDVCISITWGSGRGVGPGIT
jgi:hypothetical protein